MSSHHLLRTGLVAVLLTLWVAPLPAQEIHWQADLGLEHNDNINLSESDPVSATVLEPAIGFTLRQHGSTFQADVAGRAEYRDYLEGPYASEFRSFLAARGNWSAIEDRLDLTAENYLTVQPVNPLAADVPSNQQQTNVFAVGPTLRFRIGPTTRGLAELRYINSWAEETREFNANRWAAALRAIKDLNAYSAISFNAVADRIDLRDDVALPDYSRYSAFVRYERSTSQLVLNADAGYTWLRYSRAGDDNVSGLLLRGHLARPLTPRNALTLDLARQYTDAAAAMMLGTSIGERIPSAISTGDATVTADSYRERAAALAWVYTGPRATVRIGPFHRDLEYVHDIVFDQRSTGAILDSTWLLRPLWAIGFQARAENTRYTRVDRHDHVRDYTLYTGRQWTAHWSWRVALSHYRRSSNLPDGSANANIVYAGLTWAR